MQTIEHHGFKAYVIDSEELVKLDKNPMYSHDIREQLSRARSQGYTYVLIITSFPRSSIPKWLREYIEGKIACYRGRFN